MLSPKLELSLVRTAALPAAVFCALFARPPTVASLAGKVVQQEARVRINAAPESVYPLLDPASAHNRWTIRRERLSAVGASGRSWRMESPALPDLAFSIEIIEATRPFRISHRCGAADGGPMSGARGSTSVYEISATGDGQSEVRLTETTEFLDGLAGFGLSFHALLMRFSLRMDLLRLKYEVETGRDADARPD